MIIRNQKGLKLFSQFLADLSRFRMPKRDHQLLARLYQDAKRGVVNSDRLKYAMPMLLRYRSTLGTLVDKTFSFKQVPRLYKLLILPALYIYLRHLLPMRLSHRRQLKKVDGVLGNLNEATKNIRVTVGKEA